METSARFRYRELRQLFIGGGVPRGAGAYFAVCRRPVCVAPGTPGLVCFKIYWKPDDPMTPYMVDAFAAGAPAARTRAAGAKRAAAAAAAGKVATPKRKKGGA